MYMPITIWILIGCFIAVGTLYLFTKMIFAISVFRSKKKKSEMFEEFLSGVLEASSKEVIDILKEIDKVITKKDEEDTNEEDPDSDDYDDDADDDLHLV